MSKKNKAPESLPGQLDMLEELGQKVSVNYTIEQRDFIEYEEKNSIILAATAGSGKSFSCIQRLKVLIDRGVDPNKIIFFSFTKAATEELQGRAELSGIRVRDKVSGKDEDGVTITTIHAFSNSLLARMGKFKKITMFYEFLAWFKKEHKPASYATKESKESYYELISNMYEDSEQLSSAIGAFKLQSADNIKAPVPQFYNDYRTFLKLTKSRDFSDMLIEVRDALRENKWIKMFRNQYDYIFIDEYQDTSTIQLQILLALNAKHYYLIGDRNQCVVKGTKIHTECGVKSVEDLTLEDKVLTGKGSDNLSYNKINDIFKNKFSGDVIKIKTESGKELITTKEHTHFAKYMINKKEWFFTYLMYKKGYGFRIGVTKSYHSRSRFENEQRFGFMNRLNGENAQKIWLLGAFETEKESRIKEIEYSLKYGVPTIVFKSRGRDSISTQEFIDSVFNHIDTRFGGKKILEDNGLDFNIPHHFPKSTNNKLSDRNINICLCIDGRGAKSIHNIEISGNLDSDKKKLISAGLKVQDNGKCSGWRIRKQSSNFGDLMNVKDMFLSEVNGIENRNALLKKGSSLNFTKSTYLLPGMTVYILDDSGNIQYDVIEGVFTEKYEGYVYDINVENTHNFVANNIFTHNSIFSYLGANCKKLEEMLKKRRDVNEMSLSVNFRSDEAIVENSNKHSSLIAVANSKEIGSVNKRVMTRIDELIELLKQPGEVVVLVRTNAIIRSLEKELLKKHVPMRYFNIITEEDIKEFKKGDVSAHLRGKLNNFQGHFENDHQVIAFIERFKKSQKFITTIHKSKGREFDECVVVNSISPDVLKECKIYDKLGPKRLERVSFADKDEESRNIHYVAVSRAKHKLHFMIYEGAH